MTNEQVKNNRFNAGNKRDGKHYWLTPPDLLRRIKEEFGDDLYDPCPYPRPENYNGLKAEWGNVNYVNPPFGSTMEDGKKVGMTAWVRKAIEEQKNGKTSILVFPQYRWVHMLVNAGVEMRSLGPVRWVATEDGEQAASGNSSPTMMFILRGKQ